MEVPLLDLKAQYATIREKVRAAVDEVLESQRFILGPHVAALEEETARLCGVPCAVGLASGTDALLLSMKAVGVGTGDAVVTSPYTFFATAGAVINLGARPLFVDIEAAGFNMDPERLSDLLRRDCTFDATSRKLIHTATGTLIKAIVPIHLYGQCAAMDEILSIAGRYQLPVIEDACQAIGATYRGACAGAFGDLGCFSFFPSKNLGGAGDGGMVISRDKDLGQLVRLLRNHGMQPKYLHSRIGFNSRLDELQAAVLRVKLPYLQQWSESRRRNAARYDAAFRSAGLLGMVQTPPVLEHRKHIFHQYVIRCQKRDELRAALQGCGIGCEIYYPLSLHQQECFLSLGYGSADFPRSNEAAEQTLALPIYPELTAEQQDYVVRCIADFYAAKG
jgi:dTDP-4-amino-4,6-dideoxygalactose transaminase